MNSYHDTQNTLLKNHITVLKISTTTPEFDDFWSRMQVTAGMKEHNAVVKSSLQQRYTRSQDHSVGMTRHVVHIQVAMQLANM